MRAKVILPVLGLACLILLLAGLAQFGVLTPAPPPAPVLGLLADSGSATPATPVAPVPRRVAIETPAGDSTGPEIDPAILEAQRVAASWRRVAELADLASRRDPTSLDTILSELSNRDARIRRAALAAAVEFGDRGAIPALIEAMESNPDPQEKLNLQKAVAYLQLPTLTEAEPGLQAAPQPSVPSGN